MQRAGYLTEKKAIKMKAFLKEYKTKSLEKPLTVSMAKFQKHQMYIQKKKNRKENHMTVTYEMAYKEVLEVLKNLEEEDLKKYQQKK